MVCVHHRQPGKHEEPVLISVCRACLARLHRRYQPPGWAPPLLVALWEEQHTHWPRQLQLNWLPTEKTREQAA